MADEQAEGSSVIPGASVEFRDGPSVDKKTHQLSKLRQNDALYDPVRKHATGEEFDTRKPYLLRMSYGDGGTKKLQVKPLGDVANFHEYEDLIAHVVLGETSETSIEPVVLLIDSPKDMLRSLQKKDPRKSLYPNLQSLVEYGCIKVMKPGPGFSEACYHDRLIHYRGWFREAPFALFKKDNEVLTKATYNLPLNLPIHWAGLRPTESLGRHDYNQPTVAQLEEIKYIETPGVLALFRQTDDDYLKSHFQEVIYRWWDSPNESFVMQQLANRVQSALISEDTAATLFDITLRELHKIILSDRCDVLGKFDQYLGEIDRDMADDYVVRPRLKEWREEMAKWRPYLHDTHAHEYPYRRLLRYAELQADRCPSWARGLNNNMDFVDQVEELAVTRKAVLEHCESTFTMLMTTMSLIESEKAINEAEQVTKLTQLAFFFIPLTFVAGIYGMNLAVCISKSALRLANDA